MNLRPRIDPPCPLRFGAMPQAGQDFCTRCARRVHNLDAMDDQQRADFLAACSGPVCVSYRVRRSPLLAAGAGLALLAGCSHTPEMTVASQVKEVEAPWDGFFVGGVDDPSQAQMVDVDALPDLPMGTESQWLEDELPAAEFVAAPVAGS